MGLIGSYYGGTPAESWTDLETLKGSPDLKKILDDQARKVAEFDPAKMEALNQKNAADYEAALAKAVAEGTKKPGKPVVQLPPKINHRRPVGLYNGMIAPLQPFALRGVIWYQGESNNGGDGPALYRKLFPAMITAWRASWGQGDFPFLFCQIAPHEKMQPEIREAQFLTWKTTANTAMVVTTDYGNAGDIHPRDKEPVGKRLALAARGIAYGETLEYSGPAFDTLAVRQDRALLRFKHVGSGLMAKDGELKGFTIAGADKKFVPAKAEITGTTVAVTSDQVPSPTAVRYGWENVPDVNLYNKDGLPASPFRTDVSSATTASGSEPETTPAKSRSADSQHPQIIYWVWKDASYFQDDRFLEKLDTIAANTPFTHVSVYMHNGFGFDDPIKVKPALAKAVARAHQLGLKIIVSPYFPAHSPKELNGRLSGMVLDNEAVLDSKGTTTIEVRAEALREKKPASSALLKAYAFRKTGEGIYAPATLRELPANELQVANEGTDAVRITVNSGSSHAGETVFVLTRHDYPYGDLFSDFWPEQFKKMLDTWADIPFDGVALDEFRYLTLNWGKPFRGRWYSEPMAKAYREHFNRSLEEDLFANRYAPEGQAGIRAAAINRYFDLLSPRPAEIDRFFMEYACKLFGQGIFKGFHNTWHNSIAGDEIWGTGVNWWGLDRAYGQTDETLPEPLRLGVGAAYPEPIFYNMFYSEIARKKKLNERDSYIEEAVAEARINGRVNYLGFDQPKDWGIPFDDALLERIGKVERRIRLLNLFNGPRPDTRLLVIFGFPSLVNWFPNATARNNYDINGSLKAEEKADAIWKSGVPCVLVSSSVIDSGKLTIGSDGRPVINGHRFDAVVFIGPEYSKPLTLAFLRKYVEVGGKLVLDGEATRGFDGDAIGADYGAIVKATVARDCTPASVAKLGLVSDWPKDGSRLEDGSVLMVDRATIETEEPHIFSFLIGSHEFKVVASGVMAFKATPEGQPQKLAAAQFVSLARDGQLIISKDNPADAVLEWASDGLRSTASENTGQHYEREGTEWVTTWIPLANNTNQPRILLVGDSITKGYAPEVTKKMQPSVTTAYFTTSASVADPVYALQLQSVLGGYQFAVIHFNNGLHGFTYSEAEYRAGYERALKIIHQLQPQARLILTLSTPLKADEGNAERNRSVDARNAIVRDLAKQFDAEIDDLHAISYGHPEYYVDNYHYKPEAISLQATQVAKVLQDGLAHTKK